MRADQIAQRADLLTAIWDESHHGTRLHDLLPADLLPSLPASRGERIEYAVTLAFSPDGVWRVARDHVGPHPGAALLEAPLLTIVLPALCRALLGRSLLLPSLPVWWLADPVTHAMLARTPHRFRLRDGLDPAASPIALADLSPANRRDLQNQVDQAPRRWIAELNLELPETRIPLLHRRIEPACASSVLADVAN